MSHSSEDETDISDSELEEYVDRCYEQLRNNHYKVKISDEVYRCPYCLGKKKLVYHFKDLLQHATDVGTVSMNREIKDKGKHLGLVKYLKNDLNRADLSSQFAGLSLELPTGCGVKELFVWPWMGILANVDVEWKDGHYIVVSSSRLRTDLAKKGFNPVRIRPLRNDTKQSRFAIVEFKLDWSGFYDAMMFEKSFEADNHGKKDYHAAPHLADKLYGWVARDDDFNSEGVIGDFLQKSGNLKTVADVESEEKRKTAMLISNLTNTIDDLKARLHEIESTYHEAPKGISNIGSRNDEILRSFGKEMLDDDSGGLKKLEM